MGCCTGEEIDFQDLRSPEQKAIMAMLGPIIQAQMKIGATPYTGMLSAPYDVGQIAAMNTMMGLGGYGGYNAPQMPLYPFSVSGGYNPTPPEPPPPLPPNPPPPIPPDPSPPLTSTSWWKYDPYNPDAWQGREKRKK